jgi:hypothetical protein
MIYRNIHTNFLKCLARCLSLGYKYPCNLLITYEIHFLIHDQNMVSKLNHISKLNYQFMQPNKFIYDNRNKNIFYLNTGYYIYKLFLVVKCHLIWMTLGSKNHHCTLDNSKLEFIKNLFPSEEAWKGVSQICVLNFFLFQHHIHKKIFNTFSTNLHAISFLFNFN